jgi:hypothetical protein
MIHKFKMATGRLTLRGNIIEGIIEHVDEGGCTIVVPNDVYKVEDNYDDVVAKVFPNDAR